MKILLRNVCLIMVVFMGYNVVTPSMHSDWKWWAILGIAFTIAAVILSPQKPNRVGF
jgi:hypothetical protein